MTTSAALFSSFFFVGYAVGINQDSIVQYSVGVAAVTPQLQKPRCLQCKDLQWWSEAHDRCIFMTVIGVSVCVCAAENAAAMTSVKLIVSGAYLHCHCSRLGQPLQAYMYKTYQLVQYYREYTCFGSKQLF